MKKCNRRLKRVQLVIADAIVPADGFAFVVVILYLTAMFYLFAQLATPNKSTLPLHTTQFDQLRSLISSLRSELTSRNEAECSALRESVVQLVEEKLTELEDR